MSPSQNVVHFNVLGTLTAGPPESESAKVCTRPRQVALLAFLALERPRGFHRRDTLLALFWPDARAEHARNSLRQALHQIRRDLGEGAIVARGDHEIALGFDVVQCDAAEFEDLAIAESHADAIACYGGPLLSGFFLEGAPAFEEWLERTRARLNERAARSAWALSEVAERKGDFAAAASWARRGAAFDPGSDAMARRLMETLARGGDRAAAVRAYDEHATYVREELDVEPDTATRNLSGAIRSALATQPLPAAANLIDVPAILSAPATNGATPSAARVVGNLAAPSRGARYWRRLATLGTVAALAIAAAAAWPRPELPVKEPVQAIAVLPFAVRAGGARLDYLREGIVDLLSAKLEGTRGLRSIDPKAVIIATGGSGATTTADGPAGAGIAKRLDARWFVIGDVMEVAGHLRVSAAMYARDDVVHPVSKATVEGDADSLFSVVDDLAGRLLAGRVVGHDTAMTNLASLTTRSLPALKSFLEGERAFRAGNDARAVAALEDAVAQDTGFALAYYKLAMATRWSSGRADGPVLAAKAAERASRLPAVARNLLVGYQVYQQGDGDTAEQMFRFATRSHPDNADGWFLLGETLFHFGGVRGRSLAEAREPFSRVLALNPGDAHARVHLARIAAFERNRPELDSLVSAFIAADPSSERTMEMRALHAFAFGTRLQREAVARDAIGTSDVVLSGVLAAATAYGQGLADADLLVPAFEVPGRHVAFVSDGIRSLGLLGFARGIRHPSGSIARLAARERDWPMETHALFAVNPFLQVPRAELEALRDSIARWQQHETSAASTFAYHATLQRQARLFLHALLSLRLGDTAQAAAGALELERLSRARSDSGVGITLAHVVRADLTRSSGALDDALAVLDSFPFGVNERVGRSMMFVGNHARFLRAELLHGLRRDDEAIQWFGSTSGGSDMLFLAPAQFRLGQIFDARGDRASAIAHYQRFVTLWKDSDADLRAPLDVAQRALTRLAR